GLAAANPSGSYTFFGGQTVSSTAILIQMTRGADANMDGIVNGQDVTIVGNNFGKSTSGQWYLGDFDYNGKCDGTDVSILGTTFGKTTPTLSPSQLTADSLNGPADYSNVNFASPYGLQLMRALYGDGFESYFEAGLRMR